MQQRVCLRLSLKKRTWSPALGVILSILGVACVSSEKPVESKAEVIKTHYVLEPGPMQKGDAPLPDLTPIYVKIYAGDQMIERRLAYRAWDFNRDGNFDMLEYLDGQGRVTKRSYDMNHDGQVDLEKEAELAPSH